MQMLKTLEKKISNDSERREYRNYLANIRERLSKKYNTVKPRNASLNRSHTV